MRTNDLSFQSLESRGMRERRRESFRGSDGVGLGEREYTSGTTTKD